MLFYGRRAVGAAAAFGLVQIAGGLGGPGSDDLRKRDIIILRAFSVALSPLSIVAENSGSALTIRRITSAGAGGRCFVLILLCFPSFVLSAFPLFLLGFPCFRLLSFRFAVFPSCLALLGSFVRSFRSSFLFLSVCLYLGII